MFFQFQTKEVWLKIKDMVKDPMKPKAVTAGTKVQDIVTNSTGKDDRLSLRDKIFLTMEYPDYSKASLVSNLH